MTTRRRKRASYFRVAPRIQGDRVPSKREQHAELERLSAGKPIKRLEPSCPFSSVSDYCASYRWSPWREVLPPDVAGEGAFMMVRDGVRKK